MRPTAEKQAATRARVPILASDQPRVAQRCRAHGQQLLPTSARACVARPYPLGGGVNADGDPALADEKRTLTKERGREEGGRTILHVLYSTINKESDQSETAQAKTIRKTGDKSGRRRRRHHRPHLFFAVHLRLAWSAGTLWQGVPHAVRCATRPRLGLVRPPWPVNAERAQCRFERRSSANCAAARRPSCGYEQSGSRRKPGLDLGLDARAEQWRGARYAAQGTGAGEAGAAAGDCRASGRPRAPRFPAGGAHKSPFRP